MFDFRSYDCRLHVSCLFVYMCLYVYACLFAAADSNPEVAKHELCVSAAMRAVDDTSLWQCIFLLISIAQLVLALHVFKSLCG